MASCLPHSRRHSFQAVDSSVGGLAMPKRQTGVQPVGMLPCESMMFPMFIYGDC